MLPGDSGEVAPVPGKVGLGFGHHMRFLAKFDLFFLFVIISLLFLVSSLRLIYQIAIADLSDIIVRSAIVDGFFSRTSVIVSSVNGTTGPQTWEPLVTKVFVFLPFLLWYFRYK